MLLWSDSNLAQTWADTASDKKTSKDPTQWDHLKYQYLPTWLIDYMTEIHYCTVLVLYCTVCDICKHETHKSCFMSCLHPRPPACRLSQTEITPELDIGIRMWSHFSEIPAIVFFNKSLKLILKQRIKFSVYGLINRHEIQTVQDLISFPSLAGLQCQHHEDGRHPLVKRNQISLNKKWDAPCLR